MIFYCRSLFHCFFFFSFRFVFFLGKFVVKLVFIFGCDRHVSIVVFLCLLVVLRIIFYFEIVSSPLFLRSLGCSEIVLSSYSSTVVSIPLCFIKSCVVFFPCRLLSSLFPCCYLCIEIVRVH